MSRLVLPCLAGLLVAMQGCATTDAPVAAPGAWRDTFTTRVQALALVQSLNAELLSNDSATLTLDRWCARHRLATPAHIVAERAPDATRPPTPELRKLLSVDENEPVRYRQVRLRCGEHVLSRAENWYVPSRLTPEMNRTLETTDTSFGRAVRDLDFRRRTLSSTLLWSPLPDDWARGVQRPAANPREANLQVPAEVLQHRAVLTLPDGTPFSALIETYTSDVIDFPEPTRALRHLP